MRPLTHGFPRLRHVLLPLGMTVCLSGLAAAGPAGAKVRLATSTPTATPSTFLVVTSASPMLGQTEAVKVEALDAGNNIITGYTGTVQLAAHNSADVITTAKNDKTDTTNSASIALVKGVHTFYVNYNQADALGSDTLTASAGNVSGTAVPDLGAGVPAKLVITAPTAPSTGLAPVTAGSATTYTVKAENAYGVVVAGFNGSVTGLSSDTSTKVSGLPSAYAYTTGTDNTATTYDNGSHGFSITLATAKANSSVTFKATDSAGDRIASATIHVKVVPGAAKTLVVTAPSSAIAGDPNVSVKVKALDADGNLATGYTGTVTFTGPAAIAGTTAGTSNNDGTYTFTTADAGVHTFAGSNLTTVGTSQTITATDASTSTLSPDSAGASVTVTAGAVSKLAVAGPSATSPAYGVTDGASANVTVTAENSWGVTVPTFTGAVVITSTNTGSTADVLPKTVTFTSGVATVAVTLNTSSADTVTATEKAHSTITGSLAITPSAAVDAVTQLVVVAPSTATEGVLTDVTVKAEDASGKVVSGFDDNLSVGTNDDASDTEADGQTLLPYQYTFTGTDAGSHTFGFVFNTYAGERTIEVTDKTNSALDSYGTMVTVTAP